MVACVTIFDHRGRPFTNVTAGDSLFEAVANAVDWFRAPIWHGPKPRADTVFRVTLVGDDRRWSVPLSKVEAWRRRSSAASSAAI